MKECAGGRPIVRMKAAAAFCLCVMVCWSRGAGDRIGADVRALKFYRAGSVAAAADDRSPMANKRHLDGHESPPDGDLSAAINQFEKAGAGDVVDVVVDQLCRFHGDAWPLLSDEPVSIHVHHELFDTSVGLVAALPYAGKKLSNDLMVVQYWFDASPISLHAPFLKNEQQH